ncbi:PREDICTED: WAT1-related protein At3g30340-like [Nelumbo nucifera]|uniref:WAT1-related protein n=1 Tax=Nelumbo nucifera TaxID=4432 RepID=A0A1U8AT81_NELNU|nr:PREDICTED: WAT1-related protein At3g30340-like [Nelumbo nucifera]
MLLQAFFSDWNSRLHKQVLPLLQQLPKLRQQHQLRHHQFLYLHIPLSQLPLLLLLSPRISKQYPCQYSSTTIMSFFRAIQSAVLSLVIERDISLWVLRGKAAILTVLYAGIMGSGLSFVGMSWCVKKRDPLFTSAFSPLIQIIVAIIDFFILHEKLNLGSVLGSVLVIIGLYSLVGQK